jgi:hypothetical protein
MRVPLIGGSYKARSLIADAQRCVNLFGERNPQGAPVPMTYYPRPGLLPVATAPVNGWRGLYFATNGALFGVVGQNIYYIDPLFNFTLLGSVTTWFSQISMSDNGLVVVIVDGSANGYCIDLTTPGYPFSQIADTNFLGADKVDFTDTYFVFNQPGTANMYISLSEITATMLTTAGAGTAFDSLDIAAKSGKADPISSLIVTHREIWLIGTETTEVWFNSGASDFTFQAIPGVFLMHGSAAKYSIATQDVSVYWLGNDVQGQRIVYKGNGYAAHRISTHAIETAIAQYAIVSDAIGFCYQIEGHSFYQLVFPNANRSWCFDEATQEWHETLCLDPQGNFMRHWGNCVTAAYGKILMGDFQNGNLYALSLSQFQDNTTPTVYVRGFPHLMGDDNQRIYYDAFDADMEVGTDTGAIDGSSQTNPPMISLRWSDDRGKTFGNWVEQPLGALGLYRTSPQWRRLGIARDRVFELSWSCPTKTALNGAFINMRQGRS